MKKRFDIVLISLIVFLSTTFILFYIREGAKDVMTDVSQTTDLMVDVNTPEKAIKMLKEGNERFVNDISNLNNVHKKRRDELKNGQHPYAVILTCSDSRISPSLIFNVGLGEIFEVRLAGNVVNEDALASIEYAVKYLETPLIVVMGHEDCGAVISAYDMLNNRTVYSHNLTGLLKKIESSIKNSNSIEEAIKLNIENSASIVKKDSIINEKLANGSVKIVKGYYSLDGKVNFFE